MQLNLSIFVSLILTILTSDENDAFHSGRDKVQHGNLHSNNMSDIIPSVYYVALHIIVCICHTVCVYIALIGNSICHISYMLCSHTKILFHKKTSNPV